MDLLESPLEALAFSYSAALVGSTWAWLAVAFAAFSLWRIRAVGSSSIVIKPEPDVPTAPVPVASSTAAPAAAENYNNSKPRPPSCHVEGDCEGCWSGTKGIFTVYFHVDDNCEEEEDGGGVANSVGSEEEEEVVEVEVAAAASFWSCEGMRGDLGWYRHLDLTALDGAVVKLWDFDGGLRRRRL